MKKKFLLSLLLCLSLIVALPLAAYAQSADTALGHIADVAGILSQEERQELETAAASVSQQYGCGVYIVTVPDCMDYSNSSVADAAENIYTSCDLGLGDEKNGVMLMLSMDGRDYYLLTHGSVANTAFTDYGKDTLEDCFLDDFRNDDWMGGFSDYIRECGLYMDYASQGNPVDTYVYDESTELGLGAKLLMSVIPACVIALIVCFIFKAQMKTARKQTQARAYIGNGGVNMKIVQDHFTHRTQTVQVIQRDSNRGGGRPGGTTINSRGFSGRGGKF